MKFVMDIEAAEESLAEICRAYGVGRKLNTDIAPAYGRTTARPPAPPREADLAR